MKGIAIILLVICLGGCGGKDGSSSGILKADEMQTVLWDIMRADAYTNQYLKKDSLKDAAFENAILQQKIFALHKIKREDFYNSFRYYDQHPEMMRMVLDSITARGEREKYTTLYAKPVIKPFSLMPSPPPPPIVPLPGKKFEPTMPADTAQKMVHQFIPEL
jgi:hypothetical protein